VTQQINLFNPVFLKQKKLFSATAMAQALCVLLGGVLAVAFYARHNVAGLQREADSGRERLAQREQRLGKVKAEFAPRVKSAGLDAQLAEAETRIAALRRVAAIIERGELGNTRGYAEYFKALARQNPSGVWLTGVSISGAGNELGVQGRALDAALVPAYLGRLKREPVMRGKAFGSLKINQPVSQAGASEAKDAKETPAAPFVEFSLDAGQAEAAK
jgi:Tfp pilus assembly protein PilN